MSSLADFHKHLFVTVRAPARRGVRWESSACALRRLGPAAGWQRPWTRPACSAPPPQHKCYAVARQHEIGAPAAEMDELALKSY